jgi:hypothetical protein
MVRELCPGNCWFGELCFRETTSPPPLGLIRHEQHVELRGITDQRVEAEAAAVLIGRDEDQMFGDVTRGDLNCGNHLGVQALIGTGFLAQTRESLRIVRRCAHHRYLSHTTERSNLRGSQTGKIGWERMFDNDVDSGYGGARRGGADGVADDAG